MSKSLEYCIRIASDPSRSSFADRPWKNAFELDGKEIIDSLTEGIRAWSVGDSEKQGNEITTRVEITINPDADFAWFTSSSCIHDGSLVFQVACVRECLDRIFRGQTFNAKYERPETGDTIEYTIGNPVVLNEFGDFGIAEKPWLSERTTVLIPLNGRVVGKGRN